MVLNQLQRPVGGLALGHGLVHNKCLRELDLGFNAVTDSGADAIVRHDALIHSNLALIHSMLALITVTDSSADAVVRHDYCYF